METAGRIIEKVLKYINEEEGTVKREDIKDKFGLEVEDAERILQFLVTLKLTEIDNCEVLHVCKEVDMVKFKLIGGGAQLKITDLGQGFLQL
jgi:hypothetical protein